MTAEKETRKTFYLNWGFREETLINNPMYLRDLVKGVETEFYNRHLEQNGIGEGSDFEETMELANLVDRQIELFNKRGETSPVSINPNFSWPLLKTLFSVYLAYGYYIDIDEKFPGDEEISKRLTLLKGDLRNASALSAEKNKSLYKFCGYLAQQILDYQKYLKQMRKLGEGI